MIVNDILVHLFISELNDLSDLNKMPPKSYEKMNTNKHILRILIIRF